MTRTTALYCRLDRSRYMRCENAKKRQKVGTSYCGSKWGVLAANIAYAMDREDLRAELLTAIKKYI